MDRPQLEERLWIHGLRDLAKSCGVRGAGRGVQVAGAVAWCMGAVHGRGARASGASMTTLARSLVSPRALIGSAARGWARTDLPP